MVIVIESELSYVLLCRITIYRWRFRWFIYGIIGLSYVLLVLLRVFFIESKLLRVFFHRWVNIPIFIDVDVYWVEVRFGPRPYTIIERVLLVWVFLLRVNYQYNGKLRCWCLLGLVLTYTKSSRVLFPIYGNLHYVFFE
jgi:hypothetical protein